MLMFRVRLKDEEIGCHLDWFFKADPGLIVLTCSRELSLP